MEANSVRVILYGSKREDGIQDSGYKLQDTGCKMQDAGLGKQEFSGKKLSPLRGGEIKTELVEVGDRGG